MASSNIRRTITEIVLLYVLHLLMLSGKVTRRCKLQGIY